MFHTRRGATALLSSLLLAAPAAAQDAPAATPRPPRRLPRLRAGGRSADKGMETLTVFLRHDESQTLDEINARLKRQGFYESFPPPGVEVLSWNVLMGVGQVVTLRFPPERLREVNRAIEKHGLGRLPHRVLPHLRLPADGAEGARGDAQRVQVIRGLRDRLGAVRGRAIPPRSRRCRITREAASKGR